MKSSVAQSTWKSRASQWRCYVRFCLKFKLYPLPCSDDQLSLYATHLSEYMSHSSIIVYLQAVIFGAKLALSEPPCISNPSVKLVLEGTKRNGIPVSSGAIPITLPVLKKLYSVLNLSKVVSRVFWVVVC